jgi:hypothetical protein
MMRVGIAKGVELLEVLLFPECDIGRTYQLVVGMVAGEAGAMELAGISPRLEL